jgi:hypothetical protein
MSGGGRGGGVQGKKTPIYVCVHCQLAKADMMPVRKTSESSSWRM